MQLSKLNCCADAVKRAPTRRPPGLTSGSGKNQRVLNGQVALRRLQNPGYIAGETTIHRSDRQGLCPHGIVGKTMNGDERSCGKFAAEFCQLRVADKFEVDDGERGPEPGDGVSGFVQTVRSCDTWKLLLNRLDDDISQRGIAVSENDMDWPHGSTPSLSRNRRMAPDYVSEQCGEPPRRRETTDE